MSITYDQIRAWEADIASLTGRLKKCRESHNRLLAAAKWALRDLCLYIDPASDVTIALEAAIAATEEFAP